MSLHPVHVSCTQQDHCNEESSLCELQMLLMLQAPPVQLAN